MSPKPLAESNVLIVRGYWELERKFGSAQESEEACILSGFLENDEFCLSGGQSLCL